MTAKEKFLMQIDKAASDGIKISLPSRYAQPEWSENSRVHYANIHPLIRARVEREPEQTFDYQYSAGSSQDVIDRLSDWITNSKKGRDLYIGWRLCEII